MEVQIKRSKRKDKKFDAIIAGKMAISFGAKGMSDYTRHKDAERNGTLLDMGKTRTGLTRRRRAFMLRMFFGTRPV